MASFTISTRMEVDERGFQTVERGLGRIENRARNVRAELSGFRILGLAIIGRQIQSLADEFSTLQNRIRFVTNSEAELAVVTEKLLALSNDTRSSFANNTQLFTRLAVSSRELGFSFKELLQFTTSLNKTIALSGATTKEAGGALIQLSQGLASGALRGDELRSVLEQLPAVADVIARKFDTTRGSLRSLGQQGRLTSREIIQGFLDQGEAIDKSFAKSVPTLRQALEVLRNQIVNFIGQTDRSGGVTSKFAQLTLLAAQNVETLARIITTVLVAKALARLITAFSTLRTVILTNPIVLIPALIALAAGAFVGFADKITIATDGLATLQDFAVTTFEVLRDTFGPLISDVGEAFTSLIDPASFSFEEILRVAATTIDAVVGVLVGGAAAFGVVFDSIADDGEIVWELFKKSARDALEATLDFVLAIFQTIGDTIRNLFSNIKQVIANSAGALGALSSGNAEAAQAFADNAETAAKRLASSLGEIPNTFKKNLRALGDADILAPIEITQQAQDLGARAAEEFNRAFQESTGATDTVDKIFNTAEKRAQERAAEENKRRQDIAKAQAFLEQGFDPADPAAFIEKIERLREENDLIIEQIGLNKQQQDSLEALSKVGISLSQSQRERFLAQAQLNAGLKEELRLYNEITGPIQKYSQEKEALDMLLALGNINQDQYNRKLLDLEIAANRASGTIGGELKARIGELSKEVGDAAKIIGDIFTSAINNTADALTEFVVNGKADIKQFAQSFITDIVRILVKLLILQALQAVTGTAPAGAAAGAAVNVAARAEGGPVEANKAFLVGEEGPELFVPKSMGQIIPADRTAAVMSQSAQAPQEPAAPPVVNVAVQNVIDPSMSLDAMATPQGHKVIVNAIRSNKGAIKRDLA